MRGRERALVHIFEQKLKGRIRLHLPDSVHIAPAKSMVALHFVADRILRCPPPSRALVIQGDSDFRVGSRSRPIKSILRGERINRRDWDIGFSIRHYRRRAILGLDCAFSVQNMRNVYRPAASIDNSTCTSASSNVVT